MNGETIEYKLFKLVSEYNKRSLHLSGGVYYRGLRPIAPNATSYNEDAVVAFLSGIHGDVQQGTCLVNVYIPDIQANSGTFYANKQRCADIAYQLEQFPAFANKMDDDMYFRQSDIIYSFAEENIHQHFVSLKMDFKVYNTNY